MPPKLKICQLYHEKLFLQKVNVELVSKLDRVAISSRKGLRKEEGGGGMGKG